ncbi:hypothetical protein LCGC14_0321300 [marine sediment metagenome]|uniref:Uncharacterized protein n=1 Tax=marine sediment metagenome TaxID=412755 RepID=A0A0F9WRC8_9ZZZZ
MDPSPRQSKPPLFPPGVLVAWLKALAIVTSVAGLVGATVLLHVRMGQGDSVLRICGAILSSLWGLTSGALLWTVAWIVTRVTAEPAPAPSGASSEAKMSGSTLGDSQVVATEQPASQAAGPAMADERPEPGRGLTEQSSRVEELMSMGAFDHARQLARDLMAEFPAAGELEPLLQRVDREAEAFARQQRQRLYEQVDRSCQRRQWRAALAAAQELVNVHPATAEAAEVTGRLATLQENARIEEVRELRDRIRDLIERRRYHDAATVAEDIVARFADTQAAADLRGQIDQLNRLAARGIR